MYSYSLKFLSNHVVKYDKAITVGFSVLELSKYLMYDFNYNVIKKLYPDDKKCTISLSIFIALNIMKIGLNSVKLFAFT